MNTIIRSSAVALLLLSFSKPNGLAQSQTAFDRLDDFGDGSVQTFIAEQTGVYHGVSLVLFAHGTGSDVMVQVRKRELDGSLAPGLLATGFVPASLISTSTPAWHFIVFDSPVNISAGASFGLVLNEPGAASTGYVDYGSTTGNPYANGRMMWESLPGQPLSPIFPDLDLAFQNTVAVPEPRIFAFFISGVATFLWVGRFNRIPQR